jgi:molybdopterin-guanine dinucleotide biosynthesis protein A
MFDGYILVGGKSSRMKTSKVALRLGDETFAERAFAALRKITAGRISFVLSVNQTGSLLPPNVPQITDIFPHKAALSGIYTSLAHSTNEWAVVLACDYPFVTKDLFVRMAEITNSVDREISVVAPIQADGRVQPLCSFYRVETCLAVAEQLLISAEILPARQLLELVGTRLVYHKELADLSGAENFFTNINTPGDFRRAQIIYQRLQKS